MKQVKLTKYTNQKTSSPMGVNGSPGTSIMFGDTIIYDAQGQVTLEVVTRN